MERYSEYKDSGVKWLGEIPSHWEFVAAKKLYLTNDGGVWGTDPTGTDDTIVIRSTEQDVEGNLFLDNPARRHLTNSEINKALLKENDLIITKSSGSINHIGKTSLIDKEIATRKCCFSNFIQRIHLKGNAKFYWYVFNNKLIKDQFAILSSTTTGLNNISSEIINNILLPLLPFEEQDSIVSYLDSVTSKIDRAIAQQQRMIELLNERKQIIINNAVTKGLDPNVPMKDSGVEWIGMIPEHWEVRKLGTIGSTINGVSHDSTYFGEGFPFLSYSDVYKNYSLPNSVDGLAKSSRQERSFYSVEEGDVFFTRTSETAEEIGFTSTCLLTIPNAVFAGFLIRFRPQKGYLSKYFSKYYFRANIHRSYFVKEMNLVIRASLSQQLLKRLPVLLPPQLEQVKIASYLDRKTKEIDSCIDNYVHQISLLQERKQIIINDVVTGKVKVV